LVDYYGIVWSARVFLSAGNGLVPEGRYNFVPATVGHIAQPSNPILYPLLRSLNICWGGCQHYKPSMALQIQTFISKRSIGQDPTAPLHSVCQVK